MGEKAAHLTMTLELDAADYQAVQSAFSVRQGYGGGGLMPPGGSNTAGALVAEICRAYLDYVQMLKKKKK